jgi:hypothetical protein
MFFLHIGQAYHNDYNKQLRSNFAKDHGIHQANIAKMMATMSQSGAYN